MFTFWTLSEKHYVRRKRTVFGTKVTIARVPGWSGDLNLGLKHRKLRQEIRDAVSSFKKGPHAIILAMKVNSTFTKTTQETLENVLTERFWDHTIIVFTGGHAQMNIEHVISQMNLKSLIETSSIKHCVLQKPNSCEESKELIEDIALMIAERVPLRFSVDESEQPDESHEKKNLLKRLGKKIQKLHSSDKKTRMERTESMMEIRRLENIRSLHEDLATNPSQSDQSACEAIHTERPTSTTETTVEIHHTEASKLLSTKMTCGNNPVYDAYELNGYFKCDSRLPVSECDFRSWYDCLVKILEDLSEEQFKKMKNKMCSMQNDRIPTSHAEDKDRNTLARNMIERWGEEKCISYTRDILKDIPRNDKEIIKIILPFLQSIGESW
ncbi:uncharacterized protein LOC103035600 [Astyanax mexicanus]|uniref:uncharacterized protein LOC103035600 n=1 Tax=Astyanax mexicanus TaxID=7994 RepID=UPI0020CB1C4C|nr:uncharacterized protein LOC103035600 [Astyanax mexicanus]